MVSPRRLKTQLLRGALVPGPCHHLLLKRSRAMLATSQADLPSATNEYSWGSAWKLTTAVLVTLGTSELSGNRRWV